MRRITSLIFLLCLTLPMMAVGYYAVNIDWKTSSAMLAAYNVEGAMELMGEESTKTMLKHYKNAEIASAGIFLTKYMDQKYLRDAGILSSPQENAYYKRIYRLVSSNIIPKTWDVAKLMVRYPDRAPYWAPFLIKTCEDTKSLCMQFECVVTNNKLSFGDIPFLSVSEPVRNVLDLSHFGGVDWKGTFEDLANLAEDITIEDLKLDLDDIMATGAAIASAGGVNEEFWRNSNVGQLFGGIPQTIYGLYGTVGQLYDNLSGDGIKNMILGILGGTDEVALTRLFETGDYDISQMVSNYNTPSSSSYYTKRYYIYTLVNGSSKKEVYEEVFDSYSMDSNVFYNKLNGLLMDYRSKAEQSGLSTEYYLGSDEKRYYEATDATRIKGVSTVSFTVNCTDGQKLGEGSTSWKENGDQGKSLGEESKEFAMRTSLEDRNPTSQIDKMISDVQNKIDNLKKQILLLETERNDISSQLHDLGYDAQLMARYNELEKEIKELKGQLASAEEEYSELQETREEVQNEFSQEEDDVVRIPSIMHDCQVAYNITWDGEGYWNGFTYIRKGHIGSMQTSVTFRARLSLQRKPKYVFGIRVHRAILQIDWELTSEYSYSDVVEIRTLDPDKSDEERAEEINSRLSELAQLYPSCTVVADYRKSKSLEADAENGLPHFLWASNRLAIARDIESRLVSIYTKLVMLEKYILSSKSLKDMIFDSVMNGIDHSKRKSIGIEALNRWKESANNALSGRKEEESQI